MKSVTLQISDTIKKIRMVNRMICDSVSQCNSEIARNRAQRLIDDVQSELSEEYKFSYRLVGSASRNTIIKDKNGKYDLDYQFLLTHNSKSSLKANNIKPRFLRAFNIYKNNNEVVEDSKTAITIVNKHHNYSIDFVVLKILGNPDLIIRRNNKQDNITKNSYDWNQLPKINQAYDKFDKMSKYQKKDVCENKIIPRKCLEKQKDDSQRISSMRIFVEEINNY